MNQTTTEEFDQLREKVDRMKCLNCGRSMKIYKTIGVFKMTDFYRCPKCGREATGYSEMKV